MYAPRNSWAYNAHQLIMHKIPGCTAGRQSCNHHMSDLYFVVKNSQIWCYFCTHADLLIQSTCAHLTLSPSTNMASSKEKKKLLYTPVPIVREKELLLVNECTDHLGQFGLTLWVVSMNQTAKNCDLLNQISMWHVACYTKNFFKYICMLQFLDVHGRLEFVYNQEYHYCTPKNFYFYFIFCCCMPKNFYFYVIFC